MAVGKKIEIPRAIALIASLFSSCFIIHSKGKNCLNLEMQRYITSMAGGGGISSS